MPQVQDRKEPMRGCGYRQPGGIYLVCRGPLSTCGKLPLPVDVCPTCGCGIKPARGWTWINPAALGMTRACSRGAEVCRDCPFGGPITRAGLLWIGQCFYATADDWLREAVSMGISRRLPANRIPRGLEIGSTWVVMGHRAATRNAVGQPIAALVHAFRPTAIEYVVTGRESEKELEVLEERGLTLVRVTHPREGVQQPRLFDEPVPRNG